MVDITVASGVVVASPPHNYETNVVEAWRIIAPGSLPGVRCLHGLTLECIFWRQGLETTLLPTPFGQEMSKWVWAMHLADHEL